MLKLKHKNQGLNRLLPLLVEKGEDGFYVIECSLFDGRYSQGKTIDIILEKL